MKIVMEVYLKGLKKEINRQIIVNENINLQDFCEYVIVSMNGDCKHLYQLILNDEYTYLGPGCDILYAQQEEMMEGYDLSDLDLQIGDKLMLNYDFSTDWEFIIKIKNIKKENPKDSKRNFEVISGKGQGILEGFFSAKAFKKCINSNLSEKEIFSKLPNQFKDYINKKFDVSSINEQIDEYVEKYRELVKPKRYIMNISLEGFKSEIKRKISVDSNVKIYQFCRSVITSMNGDLSHIYGMKIGREYIDDEILKEQDLNYLELKENQKLKIIYDFGDNWVFNITVNKIIEEYGHTRKFNVLSGKGYGIIDDCGGVGELCDIFNKINKEWGECDINDFDVDRINRKIDIFF